MGTINSEISGIALNGNVLKKNKMKLLWKNPNPTSVFTAQTVTLSSSDYDELKIIYKKSATEDFYDIQYIPKGHSRVLFFIDDTCVLFVRRVDYKTDTSLVFQKASLWSNSLAYQQQDTRCIPVEIYGIKNNIESTERG